MKKRLKTYCLLALNKEEINSDSDGSDGKKHTSPFKAANRVEESVLSKKLLNSCVLENTNSNTDQIGTNLKPQYDPGQKFRQIHSIVTSSPDACSVNNAQVIECASSGAYFYHNEPKF